MDSYQHGLLSGIGSTLTTIGLIGIALLIIFLLREYFNWYWKHNEMIEIMKKQTDKLIDIENELIKVRKRTTE